MDGLEKRLQDDKKPETKGEGGEEFKTEDNYGNGREAETPSLNTASLEGAFFPLSEPRYANVDRSLFVELTRHCSGPSVGSKDALLDTYFSRSHGKPYRILDEPSIREKHQLNQLPSFLLMAIYAIGAR
jgi:hypothetical protein